jgi:hypothetical protein
LSFTLFYLRLRVSDKKKEAKRTVTSVLRGGLFLSTIFIQLLKTSSLSKDGVIGFIPIRTGALLEEMAPGLLDPCTTISDMKI